MMKKLLAVLLLTALTLSLSTAALAELEFTDMECVLLNYFDKSESEWMSTEYNRCTFTALALLDYLNTTGIDGDDVRIDWNCTVCGRGDTTLCTVIGFTQNGVDKSLFVLYAPSANMGLYAVTTCLTESAAKELLSGSCTDGVYSNSLATMLDAMGDLIDIAND